MISATEIRDRGAAIGLREDVVEKEYVIGWLLWGIASEPALQRGWAFKGGTCLKKCYIETYRFSEDLDFTVLPGEPSDFREINAAFASVMTRVEEASGIDLSSRLATWRPTARTGGIEGRIYYVGPRGAQHARVKIDLLSDEVVSEPTVLRQILHPYADKFPTEAQIRCYELPEVLGEKLRALAQRRRPRDLYDVVNLYRRTDMSHYAPVVRRIYLKKCSARGIEDPLPALLVSDSTRDECRSEWSNMLAHQLPALPPFESFWEELGALIDWLASDGAAKEPLPTLAAADELWEPPSTVWAPGDENRLEPVRFAATNHLLVDLGYNGGTRLIEPYSLRRSRAGSVSLYGVRPDSRCIRAYRIDRIQSVTVTETPFTPAHPIEFPPHGPLSARPRRSGRRGTSRSRIGAGPDRTYIIRCGVCGRQFSRKTYSTRLRPHNNPDSDWKCYGRQGFLVDTVY